MSLSDIIECVDFSSSTIEEGTYVLSCTSTSVSSEEYASQFMQVYIEEEESPIKKEEAKWSALYEEGYENSIAGNRNTNTVRAPYVP